MRERFKGMYVLVAFVAFIAAACGAEATTDAPAAAPADDAVAADVADPDVADHEEPADHDEGTDHDDDEADHDEPLEADRVVEIELGEFTIEAASFDFVPGETVEFVVTNSGLIEHELRLSNHARVEEHVAGGHADHDEEMSDEEMADMDEGDDHESDDHEVEDMVLLVAAGETATVVFTFNDNDHDFTTAVCLLPGHYEAGMVADLNLDA